LRGLLLRGGRGKGKGGEPCYKVEGQEVGKGGEGEEGERKGEGNEVAICCCLNVIFMLLLLIGQFFQSYFFLS